MSLDQKWKLDHRGHWRTAKYLIREEIAARGWYFPTLDLTNLLKNVLFSALNWARGIWFCVSKKLSALKRLLWEELYQRYYAVIEIFSINMMIPSRLFCDFDISRSTRISRIRDSLSYNPMWSCHAYVPVSQLIYAAFRSNAKGLLPPNDECLRRGL